MRSHIFSIGTSLGDVVKLSCHNSREKSEWVARLTSFSGQGQGQEQGGEGGGPPSWSLHCAATATATAAASMSLSRPKRLVSKLLLLVDEVDECPVCFSDQKSHLVVSKCKHVFCRNCFDFMLGARPVCPNCRQALEEDAVSTSSQGQGQGLLSPPRSHCHSHASGTSHSHSQGGDGEEEEEEWTLETVRAARINSSQSQSLVNSSSSNSSSRSGHNSPVRRH